MALLLLLLPAPLLLSAARPAPTGVTVGALLPEDPRRYPWAWPRVGPALSLALEALQPQLSQAALAVRPVFVPLLGEDKYCDWEEAKLRAAHLWLSQDPDVLLLGATCGLDLVFTGKEGLARRWGLPLLMTGVPFGEEDFYAQMCPNNPTGSQVRPLVTHLLRHFNWTSRAALVFSRDPPGMVIQESIIFVALDYGALVGPNFTPHPLFDSHPEQIVQFIQAHGRVVLICVPMEILHQIMHLAQARNMTNGDYVFIYMDIWGASVKTEGRRQAAKPWQSKEGPDAGGLREAFQMDRLMAGCFHDGLLLYIRALNETLREGGTKRDASRILEKIKRLQIQGVPGMVSVESNSEREMDAYLWSMADVESGEFQVVGHYIGSEKQINWLGPIHWKKGSPPLDNPPCVFDTDDPSCNKRHLHSQARCGSRPGVCNLRLSRCSWTTIPISPCQHGQVLDIGSICTATY